MKANLELLPNQDGTWLATFWVGKKAVWSDTVPGADQAEAFQNAKDLYVAQTWAEDESTGTERQAE